MTEVVVETVQYQIFSCDVTSDRSTLHTIPTHDMTEQLLSSLRTAYTLVSSIDPLLEGSNDEITAYRNHLKLIHQYCGQITAHVQGVACASQHLDGTEIVEDLMHDGSRVGYVLSMSSSHCALNISEIHLLWTTICLFKART